MEYKGNKLVKKIENLPEVPNANKVLYLEWKQQISQQKTDFAQSTIILNNKFGQ